jgi:hypothetical protein
MGASTSTNAFNLYISTTDKHVGTSAQLNAKLYQGTNVLISRVSIGANYIKGYFINSGLIEVSTNEWVNVIGWFIAMNK